MEVRVNNATGDLLDDEYGPQISLDHVWPEPPLKSDPVFRAVMISLYSLVFSGSVLGNLAVIVVILCHRRMRSFVNFFLANLAAADLFVGVFCVIPNLSIYMNQQWVIGRVACKLQYFVQSANYVCSIVILTIISVERYVVITHPMWCRRLGPSSRLRVGVVTAVWVSSCFYSLPILLAYDTRPPYVNSAQSLENVDNENTAVFCTRVNYEVINNRVYVMVNLVVLYLIPLTLMTFVYARVSLVLWRSSSDSSILKKSILMDQTTNSQSYHHGRLEKLRFSGSLFSSSFVGTELRKNRLETSGQEYGGPCSEAALQYNSVELELRRECKIGMVSTPDTSESAGCRYQGIREEPCKCENHHGGGRVDDSDDVTAGGSCADCETTLRSIKCNKQTDRPLKPPRLLMLRGERYSRSIDVLLWNQTRQSPALCGCGLKGEGRSNISHGSNYEVNDTQQQTSKRRESSLPNLTKQEQSQASLAELSVFQTPVRKFTTEKSWPKYSSVATPPTSERSRKNFNFNDCRAGGSRKRQLVGSVRENIQFRSLHPQQSTSSVSQPSSPKLEKSSSSASQVSGGRRKVIRLLIVIVVSFTLCTLPNHVRLQYQEWGAKQSVSNFDLYAPPITTLVLYFNSCLNPFLYALISRKFRKAFTELCRSACKKLCRKSSRVQTNCNLYK